MRASRPHMPGYGILPADEGEGLLAFDWVEITSLDEPVFAVRPERVFGLVDSADRFTATATRWIFDA